MVDKNPQSPQVVLTDLSQLKGKCCYHSTTQMEGWLFKMEIKLVEGVRERERI
jgi:hypothetical protein